MFLKRPDRVQALTQVILLAYLALAIIQRRARHQVESRGEPFIGHDNRPNINPTSRLILDSLSKIHTDFVQEANELIRVLKVDHIGRDALQLIGVPFEAFFTLPP